MDNEQIRAGAEEALRRLYPEALVKGSEAGVSEVDFFLEQSVVTTRHGTEESQQRVIAIIAADWGGIDATAKSICEKLQIEPDQLTILLVAGSQNHSPSPQAQGLRRHGHELRFCLVDDLEGTVGSFFDENDVAERLTAPLNQSPDKPKLNLRDLLRAEPVVIGVKKSMLVSLRDFRILKYENKQRIRILIWNVGLEDASAACPKSWHWKIFNKVLKQGDYDAVLLQEVPTVSTQDNMQIGANSTKQDWSNCWSNYDVRDASRLVGGYGNLVMMVGKNLNPKFLGITYKKGFPCFAQLVEIDGKFSLANVHLDKRRPAVRAKQIDRLHAPPPTRPGLCVMPTSVIAGDFNAFDHEVRGWPYRYVLPDDIRMNSIDHAMVRNVDRISIVKVLVDGIEFEKRYPKKRKGGHYPLAVEIVI